MNKTVKERERVQENAEAEQKNEEDKDFDNEYMNMIKMLQEFSDVRDEEMDRDKLRETLEDL